MKYVPEAARPMLRSSGSGGTSSSAPGISCATGSSDVRHHLLDDDDDELGLWPGGSTQLFQYFDAKLVGPVVEHSGEEEEGDVRLLCGLWLEEVVALGRGKGGGPNVSERNPGLWKEGGLKTLLLPTLNFHTAGFETVGCSRNTYPTFRGESWSAWQFPTRVFPKRQRSG